MSVKDRCSVCGRSEIEHHEFTQKRMPKGCMCNPLEWGDEVSRVCKDYKAGFSMVCEHCEHDEECHEPSHS